MAVKYKVEGKTHIVSNTVDPTLDITVEIRSREQIELDEASARFGDDIKNIVLFAALAGIWHWAGKEFTLENVFVTFIGVAISNICFCVYHTHKKNQVNLENRISLSRNTIEVK